MSNNKQETVDTLYVKYQRTLELLSNALDEVDTLKAELDLKPKEIEIEKIVEVEKEVEKIVEIEANIDLTTPSRVAELEAKQSKTDSADEHKDAVTEDHEMIELRKEAEELGVKGYALPSIKKDTLRAKVEEAKAKLA